MARVRLRGLGLTLGSLPTGKFNAITDVAGVKVGYFTLTRYAPRRAHRNYSYLAAWA